MKIRTQTNFNFKTQEEMFGLSLCVDGGRLYCKYPIGHQSYKTIGDASKAAVEMMERIRGGARIEYGANGTRGVNKNEYVKVID